MNILLIFQGFIIAFVIAIYYKRKIRESKNQVHFYVVRFFSGELWLSLGMPLRISEHGYLESNGISKIIASKAMFLEYGLDPKDYTNLKWRDEPVEVFLNLED